MAHPLYNPVLIFNIHSNSPITTLITNNDTYCYYDSLNFQAPHAIHRIHNTLRQWYASLPITYPLLNHVTSSITIKSTPRQTDGWSCGMHMLMVNLVTIYQGTIPILRYTQTHANLLYKIHLRYTLTGKFDSSLAPIIHELHNTNHMQ